MERANVLEKFGSLKSFKIIQATTNFPKKKKLSRVEACLMPRARRSIGPNINYDLSNFIKL